MTEPDRVTPDEAVDDLAAAEPIAQAATPRMPPSRRRPKNPRSSSRARGDEHAANAPSAAKLKPARRLSSRPVARPNARLADAARPIPHPLRAAPFGA